MEAFSHFISTDDSTAHSCRRRGRRGCLSRTPTLYLFIFFPPSLRFPQKETKKGSINVLRIYVKYHVENDFIPRFPSLLWTPPKQQILRALRQAAGFLMHAASRTQLRVPEVRSCGPSQGSAPHLPEPLFQPLSKSSVPALKYIPARLIKGKKRGVLDDWD